MIGTMISHYKILEKLGEGGMGVVYKAQDTKLDRTVALKFLPDHVSVGSGELERFVQEAKAAAGLNHPNICTIYGIEEADQKHFIAMEFVDGQMLQEKKSSLPMKQALDIGIQIAEGLAAAHEKGIVHRDIKPENIMIRKDGRVQIMDFGLAKLRGASRLTKEGSTVGTAGYMSPEQVQGQETDHRSDIFSLGVLLYEMLTGQAPFKGVHETAITYEIVNVDSPPMSAFKPEIPPELDAIVLECLEKDQRERSQSASQVAVDLKRYKRESSRQRASRITAARPALASTPSRQDEVRLGQIQLKSKVLLWVVAALLGLALLILGFMYVSSSSPERPLITASIPPPEKMNFYFYGNTAGPAAISPDGKRLAFTAVDSTGKRYLYVRSLDAPVARRLAGTDGALHPFWSPDNQFLGFTAQSKLKKIDASGGAPVTLCDAGSSRGASWSSNGTVVFTSGPATPLAIVPSAGGVPTALTQFDSLRKENSHRWPSFLPDGRHVLYLARTVATGNQGEGGFICVASIDGKESKVLVPAVSNAVYADGHLLYARGTTLVAHRFDEGSLELVGEPTTIAEGVTYDPSTNRNMFTVSSNGLLVYQTGTAQLGTRLIFHDRNGKAIRVASDLAEHYYPRFSPDEKRVAMYIYDFQSHNADIWISDLARGIKTRFTFNSTIEVSSVWSPDGNRIVFNSSAAGPLNLYQKATSGARSEEVLLQSPNDQTPWDWSRDGKFLLFDERGGSRTQEDLWILPMNGEHKPVVFLQTEFIEADARFSPDGRWMAYVSDESGQFEVYIRPFQEPGTQSGKPGSTGKWQISVSGGDAPRWRGDGRELYYFSFTDNKMMSADITVRAGSLEVSNVRPLFDVPSIVQLPGSDYDVTADGKRFLINVPFESQNQTPLTLVVNWTEKLKK